jgi:hypothetical protein
MTDFCGFLMNYQLSDLVRAIRLDACHSAHIASRRNAARARLAKKKHSSAA